MQVFLVRHAEPAADPRGPLSDAGRQQACALGDRLRWHDCQPTDIWSSPLVGALQTAELIASQLHSELAVAALPALANPADAAASVAALPADACVVIIGHEPQLSQLAARLTGAPPPAALRHAEAIRIDNGSLRWRFAWDAEAPELAARASRQPHRR